jgi:hypothetical protein
MESEFPSYGDLIMTTMGGISLGETLYRLSGAGAGRSHFGLGACSEDRRDGSQSVGGFNRLVRGDMFKNHGQVNHIRNPMAGYLAWGTSSNVESSDLGQLEMNHAYELTFRYGDPYRLASSRKPFDYFTFRLWVSSRPEKSNVSIIQQAVLVGRNYQALGGSPPGRLFQH